MANYRMHVNFRLFSFTAVSRLRVCADVPNLNFNETNKIDAQYHKQELAHACRHQKIHHFLFQKDHRTESENARFTSYRLRGLGVHIRTPVAATLDWLSNDNKYRAGWSVTSAAALRI